ncbi:MAG: M13 family metallopeptidase [Proteobacteria bacterium]|nr:M13 family metallopeptidase [Pseudomonadota bacterium]
MKRPALALGTALCAGSLLLTGAARSEEARPAYPPWGLDLSWMDKSVKPGDDFFLYANGTWAKSAEIPADRSYNGVNLELNKQNEDRLKEIITTLQSRKETELGAEDRKLRDFYNAYMDTREIEARGLHAASKDLAKIARAKTPAQIAALMGAADLQLDGPFTMYLAADDKHPDRYVLNLVQSGLGLPDRDYYLRSDKEFADTRAAYRKYLEQMLSFSGAKNAGKRAGAILELENAIAKVSWASEDRRDPSKTYNPMTVAELQALTPQFPWKSYFTAASLPLTPGRGAIAHEKSAFPELAKVFAATPISVWRDYLTVRYLHSFADELPKKLYDADFAFYGTTIQGKPAQLARATRGVALLDNAMGEALGKLYTAKYFPPDAKAKAKILVDNLLKAYEADIKTLSWMTPATREKALEKLHKITPKIGYPDVWRDYSALQISRGALIGDVQNAARFEWNREIKRIDSPVDKKEWGMTPPTNNAYYNPTFNEVVFPAGILQPPFFDPNADDAVNYGEIGATIGHELSHGFDDEGSQYDGDGVLRNWWTPQDAAAFKTRTDALIAQYDAYEPLPGIHIKGKLTLGENIADLAGLVIAYKAYHLSLNGKPAPVLDGLTGDQRFYLAYSQSWRQKDRDGRLRAQLLGNPHSPPNYRVNGIVRNDDAWYAAFPDVKEGDKYYLAEKERIRLW